MAWKSSEKGLGTLKEIDHLSENLDLTENDRLVLELEWILNNIQTYPKEVMDWLRKKSKNTYTDHGAPANTKVCSNCGNIIRTKSKICTEAHKQHTEMHEQYRRDLRRHRRTN